MKQSVLQLIVLSVLVCASAAHKSMDDDHSDTVELPVKSYRGVKVIPSPSHTEKPKTQVVVGASDLPLYVTFNSRSSPVYIKQNHMGTKGTFHRSESKDEPHRMVHEVIKPVYQELKEVIKPYRKVIQVIEPVREQQMTKLHNNQGRRQNNKGNGEERTDYGKRHGRVSYDDNYKKYGMANSYNDNDGYKMTTSYGGSYKNYDQDMNQDMDIRPDMRSYVKMEYGQSDDGDLYSGDSNARDFKMEHNNRYDSYNNDHVIDGRSSNIEFSGMPHGW